MADIRNQLEAMCDSIAEDLRECDAYGESFGDDILDIEVHGYYASDGEFMRKHVEITLTIGGPNIFADVYPDGGLVVRGYWGSDTVTRGGRASDSLVDVCDQITDARVTA